MIHRVHGAREFFPRRSVVVIDDELALIEARGEQCRIVGKCEVDVSVVRAAVFEIPKLRDRAARSLECRQRELSVISLASASEKSPKKVPALVASSNSKSTPPACEEPPWQLPPV